MMLDVFGNSFTSAFKGKCHLQRRKWFNVPHPEGLKHARHPESSCFAVSRARTGVGTASSAVASADPARYRGSQLGAGLGRRLKQRETGFSSLPRPGRVSSGPSRHLSGAFLMCEVPRCASSAETSMARPGGRRWEVTRGLFRRDFGGTAEASELLTLLRVNQEDLASVDEHQESVSFESGPRKSGRGGLRSGARAALEALNLTPRESQIEAVHRMCLRAMHQGRFGAEDQLGEPLPI